MEKHLIEEAYNVAKATFGAKNFTFKDLYEVLEKKGINVKNNAGELYVEMIQDIRFLSLGKQLWSLRENFTRDKIKKITSSMFGLDEYLEEDADKYMSKLEKEELFSKNKEEDNVISEIDDNDVESEIDIIKKTVILDDNIDDKIEDIFEENDIIDDDSLSDADIVDDDLIDEEIKEDIEEVEEKKEKNKKK